MTCARALRLAWVVCLATPALLANSVLAQPKILFVGDSITAGIGATDWAEGGFVAQIGQRFPELVVANAGCNASTIRDWTSSKPADICFLGNAWQLQAAPELPAHITHVLLGTNDARGILEHFGTLLAWEYELRLRWMIEQAPGLQRQGLGDFRVPLSEAQLAQGQGAVELRFHVLRLSRLGVFRGFTSICAEPAAPVELADGALEADA